MQTNNSYASLIAELVDDGYIRSSVVLEAFKAIDRAHFVTEDKRRHVYKNTPLEIGFGQTISQPLIVASLMELLALKPGEKVLDIGTGSGWQAALMAHIVSRAPRGKVVSIERIPALSREARQHIAPYHFIAHRRMKLLEGDGTLGCVPEAPFDKIVATAMTNTIPKAWKEQVRIGGAIVAPVRDSIVLLQRTGAHTWEKRLQYGFHFAPLVTA